MATPYMQTVTTGLQWFTDSPGFQKIGPVLDDTGAPINFTVGSWTFVWASFPAALLANNYPVFRPDSALSATIAGDSSGNITITWPYSNASSFPAGAQIGELLASNDGGVTYALAWRGVIQVVQAVPK